MEGILTRQLDVTLIDPGVPPLSDVEVVTRKEGKEKDMVQSFSLAVTGDPNALVTKAKKTAAENDATFSGDTTSGNFSGNGVEGQYEISDGTITVTITKKPFYATWSMVESRVREFFI